MNQSAGSDPHGLWHTFLTGEGSAGEKAMVGLLTLVATRGMGIKGLPSAGVMTAANMDWNKIITDVTGNDEANILREADLESVQKINESIAKYLPQAKSILDNT